MQINQTYAYDGIARPTGSFGGHIFHRQYKRLPAVTNYLN